MLAAVAGVSYLVGSAFPLQRFPVVSPYWQVARAYWDINVGHRFAAQDLAAKGEANVRTIVQKGAVQGAPMTLPAPEAGPLSWLVTVAGVVAVHRRAR